MKITLLHKTVYSNDVANDTKSKYVLKITLRNTIKIQINKIEVISDKNFFNYPLETF